MTYNEYATNLYRFFGKISILSKISTPIEEIYNKKSFESLERERNQYKQLKATFETISEEPSEGILFILSAIDQLTKNLDAVRPTDVLDFLFHLQNLDYSSETQRKVLNLLSRIFNTAIEEEMIINNPCKTFFE